MLNLSTFRDWINETSSRESRVVANESPMQSRQSQQQRSKRMKRKSKNKFMVALQAENRTTLNPSKSGRVKFLKKTSISVPQCQIY